MVWTPNTQRRKAKNEKGSEVARQSIENLARQHQAHNMSALRADGHPCLLYIPLVTGRTCTCSQHKQILDEQGNMDAEQMDSILGPDVDIYEYNSGASTPDSKNIVLDSEDFLDETDGSPPNLPIERERMAGAQLTSCNVCQGRRWVGGYSVHGGSRIVLDCTLNPKVHYGELDTLQSPNRYSMTKNGYLEFNVLIPKGAIRIDSFRLWNNDQLLKSFRVLLDSVPVTQDTLLRHPNLGRPQVLRIEFLTDLLATHFELQTAGIDLIPVDLSRYSNTTQNTMYRQLGEFTAVLPPTFVGDLKGAIIEETVEGLRFRITEMGRNSDHAGQQLFNEVQCQVVQPYELAHLLPGLNKVQHRAAQRMTQPAAISRIL